MNIPCPVKINCACEDSPFANLSAEAPDVEGFFSVQNVRVLPPLGYTFNQLSCTTVCESLTSQQLAGLCAYVQSFDCVTGGWTVPPTSPTASQPVPPPFNAPGNGKAPQFKSTSQTSTVNCPDGLPFSYTVPAGLFPGNNQADADARALSYAKQQATQHLLCLGSLSVPQTCVDQDYDATITASSKFLAAPPGVDNWLIGGSVPPGIDIDEGFISGGVIHLTGTPTVPGNYTFVVSILLANGDRQTKVYTLQVAGITNCNSLPNGTVGVSYSANVDSAGVNFPLYSVEGGSLPDGLQLDSGGIIFGTPTTNGDFNFTLGVTEAGTGLTCPTACSIHVGADCTVPAQQWSVQLDDFAYAGVAARTQNTPMILTANTGSDELFSIRMDNQATNSNTPPFPGDGPTGVSYCPTNDRMVVTGAVKIYSINPDTLTIVGSTPITGGGSSNTTALFNSSNGLMYLGVTTASNDLTVGVYDPIAVAMIGGSVPIGGTVAGPRVTIDEPNKVLYLVRNNIGDSTARLTGYDISTNSPTQVLDVVIPTPGGDPSGVIGCIFCPTNKFVYIVAAGQGGAALIRYDTASASFVNSTPVDNTTQPIAMAFNPSSNVVFVPDVAVVRCICANTDTEVGQVMVSAGDVTYQGSNQSVAWLNTDLNPNNTILDFL